MEEKLDTCTEPAGIEAVGTGEGRDCSLLGDMYLVVVESGTSLYSASIDLIRYIASEPDPSITCSKP